MSIDTSDLSLFHDNDLYLSTRTIYIGQVNDDGIDSDSAARVIKNIHILETMSHDPINVILNSLGGDELHGFAIYDALKASPCLVNISVYGHAYSAASVIMQAGDKRRMSHNSRMLLHYGSLEINESSESALTWLNEEKRSRALTIKLYHDMMKKKCKITKNAVHKMLQKDTLLTAKQCVKLGLADEVF